MIFGLELLWQQKLCSGGRVQARCQCHLLRFQSRSCFLNSALVAWRSLWNLRISSRALHILPLLRIQSGLISFFSWQQPKNPCSRPEWFLCYTFQLEVTWKLFSLLELQAFTAAFPCSGADVTDTLSRERSCPCFPAWGISDFNSAHLGSVGWGTGLKPAGKYLHWCHFHVFWSPCSFC